MITTTFTKLRAANACTEGYKKLATHLGGVRKYGASTDIPVAIIMTSNGRDDTLWTLAHACGPEGEKIAHTFACDCAERVIHLYEAKYPNDDRPRNAIEAKRSWLRGDATDGELAAAWAAAWAAGDAMAAAWAAGDAMAAAWAVAGAARAARAASRSAELEWQEQRLTELLGEEK